MQRSFAEYDGFRKQRKITRREAFLAAMDRVVPWARLEALIEPHYPVAGNGRKPYPWLLRPRLQPHAPASPPNKAWSWRIPKTESPAKTPTFSAPWESRFNPSGNRSNPDPSQPQVPSRPARH
jgi:IS5 family transposase